jgi:hypothetical protein
MEGGPPTSYVEMYQAHLGIPARPILPFWAELKAVFPGRKFDAKFGVSRQNKTWHRKLASNPVSEGSIRPRHWVRCRLSMPSFNSAITPHYPLPHGGRRGAAKLIL